MTAVTNTDIIPVMTSVLILSLLTTLFDIGVTIIDCDDVDDSGMYTIGELVMVTVVVEIEVMIIVDVSVFAAVFICVHVTFFSMSFDTRHLLCNLIALKPFLKITSVDTHCSMKDATSYEEKDFKPVMLALYLIWVDIILSQVRTSFMIKTSHWYFSLIASTNADLIKDFMEDVILV